ncbi:MAG: hypothetical protein N3A61_07505, partial [Ignavibacteria bacterium]|nr:hypothetical protein [Ignavibacteria bacterium]
METTKIKIESKSNLLFIFLGFTIVILGLEYSLYYFESRRIINEEIKNLKSIGEIELNNINSYAQYIEDEGKLILSSPSYFELFPKFVNNPNDLAIKREIELYLTEKVRETKSIDA